MDTWEERYLKLVAEHDKVLTEMQGLKKKQPASSEQLEICQNSAKIWQSRSSTLNQEIKDLYKNSFALKVESFFKTTWAWAKSGFKIRKDLGEKRFAVCQQCPHLKNDRCTLCGCFMKAKSKIPGAQCPIQKWKKVNELKDEKNT